MANGNGKSNGDGLTLFLLSKATKKKYQVLAYDKEKLVATLRSPDGKKFDFKDATVANIKKAGYDLVQA